MRTSARTRTSLVLLSGGALVISACSSGAEVSEGSEEGGAQSGEFALLAFNDFHGGLSTARELACAVELEREAHPENLLISAGDDVGASQFESAVQDDQPTLDFLNALELDASALGNHEFDQGYADITERLEPAAEFDHLAANLFEDGTDERAATPYETYEVDGLTVAVIGAVTEETPQLVVPEGVADVEFRDPIESVNQVIEDDLGDDVDATIVAFHEGSPGSVDWGEVPEDPWSQRVQSELSPQADVVLEAHTHNPYGYSTEDFTVLQTGSNGQNLGRILISVDGESGEVTAQAPELIPVADVDPAECAEMDRYTAATGPVEEAEEYAEEVGGEVLASQEGELTTAWGADRAEYVDGVWSTEESAGSGDERGAQSSLGSLTADFLQDTPEWPDGLEPDLALINAGGIRADVRTEESEDVTLREAADVMPFNNLMVVLELTGEQLREALEQQWDEEGYQQLGLSSALRYTFDASAEDGQRITSISVDGEPVQEDETYLVGLQEFLADGGDGFSAFTEAQERHSTEIIDSEVWLDYLEEQETLSPDYAQRAVELEGLEPGRPVTAGEELTFTVSALHSLSLGAPEVASVQVTLVQDGAEIPLGTADYSTDEGVGSAEVAVGLPAEVAPGDATLRISSDVGGTEAEFPVEIVG